MNNYIISCESTIDLNYDYVRSRNIEVIEYSYILNGKLYKDEMGKDEKTLPEFYKELSNGNLASTTQINEMEYEEYFMKLLEKSDNILHVYFSSGMTKSFENAVRAADKINEKYKDKNIVLVDSLSGASGYGLLIDMAADLRDEGLSMEEVKEWIINNRLKIHHYIYTTDLSYLQKGGRVSKTEAIVGGFLNIIPMIYLNDKGELKVFNKTRGKKKVVKEFLEKMEQYAENGLDYEGGCFISHSSAIDSAQELKESIESKFPNLKDKVRIYNTGPVIGSHTGQGTVGLFFCGENRPNLTK